MDKKKKILSLSAIALVGGIVALSATGGIGNLKSDSISGTWIDTGDGNGYYSYEEDPGNTGNSSVPSGQNPTAGTTSTSDPLSEQINLIASQVNTLEGDENREGSIAFLQKKIRTLQSAKIQLQKDVDAATKNLDAAKALKEIKIDIYDCTKDSKYKGLKGYDGNGYIYRNPETYLKRIGESTVQNP